MFLPLGFQSNLTGADDALIRFNNNTNRLGDDEQFRLDK
jgi:hypothetical protein